jgi:hypothetical protein
MVQLNLFQPCCRVCHMEMVMTPGLSFGSSKSYKVSQLYKDMMTNNGSIPALKWMWEGYCQQNHKVLFRLLTHNRMNTRAMLQRNNFFLPDYTCVICGSHIETRDHMFFQCPFPTVCWQYLCPARSL